MTAETVLESISYIDDGLTDRSERVLKKRRVIGKVRTVSAAAALVITLGITFVCFNVIQPKQGVDSPVAPIITAQLDDAEYEFIADGSEFLKSHGLGRPTEEQKGGYIGACYVVFDGYLDMLDGEYGFYELNGCPNRDIIIGDSGSNLSYWAAMSFGVPGESVNERLAYKGYHSIEDVHSLRIDGKRTKDSQINEIWNALTNGTEIDFITYETLIKGENYDEANAQEIYSRHADNAVEIVFNYGELNCLKLTYYKDIGCFDGLGYILVDM